MVTFTNAYEIFDGLWYYEWSSDLVDPTYRIFIDGVLVAEQTENNISIQTRSIIEVLDDPTQNPQDPFPPYFVLGWQTEPDAATYYVEQFVGAAWEIKATYANNAPWFEYSSEELTDLTSYQFRVVPLDAAGNRGTEKEFTRKMVRNPDSPSATFAYDDDTQVLTIS